MIELSEQNVGEYLTQRGTISPGPSPLLVQPLSGGVANVVLKVFDPNSGPKIGTDMRSPAQIKRGLPDTRMNQGVCVVLKQPLPKFKTSAEWLVDIDRALIERDCMQLLARILPAGSVPEVLWFDEANYVLAMSCAPTDAVIWKKQLLGGLISADAAQQAGKLLAMMHSATRNDPALQKRYGDTKFFIQQRTDPYLAHLKPLHPDLTGVIDELIQSLLHAQHCLIHGDFSPKNIFLIPRSPDQPTAPELPRKGALHPDNPVAKGLPPKPKTFDLSHLLLLDFEVSFYGHCAFDIATLINHLLLKAFYHGSSASPAMIAIDAFWQTYLHYADPDLARIAENTAGHMLGALLLARIDGKSPAEYLTEEKHAPLRAHIRTTARTILLQPNAALEPALDLAADALNQRPA